VASWKNRLDKASVEIESRKEYYTLARRKEAARTAKETGVLFLTEREAAELINSQGDVYHDAGLRAPYGYRPELFVTSDLSGKPIRHYVKLPDGTIAHPDEITLAMTRGRIVVDSEITVPSIDWKTGEPIGRTKVE
jgi:hypothetical protein